MAERLARVESRNVTCLQPPPIFWAAARGANVWDADGNRFIDLTAGFGVAAAGHANPRVTSAIAQQSARLAHGLGDVHPSEIKVRLLERLAAIAPAPLSVSILASAGAEAVEAALKTALLRTGRAGILAFERSYHGLTYGALATTARADFRDPFRTQLFAGVTFAPFPDAAAPPEVVSSVLKRIAGQLDESERGDTPIGAVLVEPVQGRGGIVLPAAGFLAGLRELCDGRARVLIFDEVYTGFGRTGRWFACEHWGVVPDILVVGKALTGSVPLSAAIGSPAVMEAWPTSHGEAIHTSTFLGNPIACAAALAQLEEIESHELRARATDMGARIRARTTTWPRRFRAVRETRGVGALQAVVMNGGTALDVCGRALRQGVLVLAEGVALDVLAITPPLVISDRQLDFALDVVEAGLNGDGA